MMRLTAAQSVRTKASSEERDDARLGRMVADRYEIVARVGLGTLGVIYEARHTTLERPVTLEVLDAELIDREATREHFKSTLRRLARVRHRNVVELEGFGVDPDGSLYIATEHGKAPRLHQELERAGRLPWSRVRGLALQLGAAIEAAHQRSVVHGGLRPEVCFMVPEPNGFERIKVADFATNDIAIEARAAAHAKGATTRLAGDPRYLALEQFIAGKGSVAADVHAMGAVLYHLLTGVPPHSGVNAFHALHQRRHRAVVPPRAIEASIPVEVEAILMCALANDPAARHSSVRELASELEAIPAEVVVQAEHRPAPAPASVPSSSRLAQAPVGPSNVIPPEPQLIEPPALVSAKTVGRGEAELDDGVTIMIARRSSPAISPEAEATAMLDALSSAHRAPRTTTEVLDAHAFGASHVVATRHDPRAVPPPPTLALALPALSTRPAPLAPRTPPLTPLPSPVEVSPSPLAPGHLAAPPPSDVQAPSPPVFRYTWLLVVGATLVVAGVGAMVGLLLARTFRTSDEPPAPAQAALPSSAAPTRSLR